MNSPAVIKNVKLLFHALTVAATVLASTGAFVPSKYALYVAIVSSVISGALHMITRIWPDAGKDEPAA